MIAAATDSPLTYTAVVTGQNNGTGTGLVEVYDLDQTADSKLANISTRGVILSAENVMIGGFILGGDGDGARVLIRAIGPSLTQLGLSHAPPDPTLELHDGNGGVIRSNDNWRDSQEAEIQRTGVAPAHDLEAAMIATLPAGAYTAVVAGGNNSTGVGLIEVFNLE
jgi:hypothetical protein